LLFEAVEHLQNPYNLGFRGLFNLRKDNEGSEGVKIGGLGKEVVFNIIPNPSDVLCQETLDLVRSPVTFVGRQDNTIAQHSVEDLQV